MEKIAIEIKSLIKNYGTGGSTTKVLRGIDLRIFAGEFVLIFGPSGSGKSTLLNIINGLEIPTSGDVIIDGESIGHLDDQHKATFHQEKIGMVFQAYNLIPSLTVLQNITLPMVFARVEKHEREQKALELLKQFELESLAHRLPTEISGGQQQRVGVMRAMIGNPPILVADEPTGNLDSVSTKNVMQLFKNLNAGKKNTLIIVTHDQSLFNYADRIIHILDGQVIKETIKHENKKPVAHSAYVDTLSKARDTKRKLLRALGILLSPPQLSAFDETELELTLESMQKRLRGTINDHELFELLDKPQSAGGAGLYRPTAHHIADNFASILELSK